MIYFRFLIRTAIAVTMAIIAMAAAIMNTSVFEVASGSGTTEGEIVGIMVGVEVIVGCGVTGVEVGWGTAEAAPTRR